MVVPGTIGDLAYDQLLAKGQPYGVEVVGDPARAFAPGVVEHPLRPLFRWWLSRRLRQQCAHAAAAAYVTQHALQERYPPAADAFSTHYSSIELYEHAFSPGPRMAKAGNETLRLVSIGSLQQLYKGAGVLLEAIRLMHQSGLDVSLDWVGGGQYRQQLAMKAEEWGLEGVVQFVGQVPAGESVRAYLDKADLFVLPSLTEGLPRAMIEAMARGLPCIGTRVGGTPELLPADYLVPPDDAQALAQKITEVARDPWRLAQMSEQNLCKAREYHADILQERRERLYSHLRERTERWLAQNAPVPGSRPYE
jgi:glycosyltransferase involved in cell wall biosynthesis